MKAAVGVRALIAVALSSIAVVAIPLSAQEPGAPKKQAEKGYDPVRHVPQFFGQVGLSPEQREEIYKIRTQHMKQIEALRQQIETQETTMLTECEAVLTDAQRSLLEDRRARATAKTKAKGSAKTKGFAKAKRGTPKAAP